MNEYVWKMFVVTFGLTKYVRIKKLTKKEVFVEKTNFVWWLNISKTVDFA